MLVLTGCSARSNNTLEPEESTVWWGSEYTSYDDDDVDAGYAPGADFTSRNMPGRRASRSPMDYRFRSLLIDTAQVALGTPYVPGGSSLRGFDCSGFVQWAYKSLGVTLPRSAREQAYYGTPVRRTELKTGDIVAFRHPRRGYHTGIYVGDGMFIHSPSRNKSVQIVPLDSAYYRENYLGARRCPLPSDKVKLEEAAARLKEHKALKASIRTERRRTYAYSSPRASSRYTSSYTKNRGSRNFAARETSNGRQTLARTSSSVKNSSVKNSHARSAKVTRSSERNSKNRVSTSQSTSKYQSQPKNTKRGAPSGRTSVSSSKDRKEKPKTAAAREGRPSRSKRAS